MSRVKLVGVRTFVGVLIKAAESVNLVVSTEGDGGIHETGRTLTNGPGDFGSIAIGGLAVLQRRVGHQEGVI